jgi:hypothetical protein
MLTVLFLWTAQVAFGAESYQPPASPPPAVSFSAYSSLPWDWTIERQIESSIPRPSGLVVKNGLKIAQAAIGGVFSAAGGFVSLAQLI